MLDLSKLKHSLMTCTDIVIRSYAQEHQTADVAYKQLTIEDFEQAARNDRSLPSFCYQITNPSEHHIAYDICGIDGSQIYPDRHEGSAVGVVHTAFVRAAYGTTSSISINTAVELLVDDEGLDASDVDALRLLHELKHVQACALEQPTTCVLFDGSLLYWNVQKLSEKLSEEYLGAYLDVVFKLYQQNIPVIGFVSLPNNRELITLIEAVTKQQFSHTRDRDLRCEKLVAFRSNHDLAKLYPPALCPCFVYVQTGAEIARIELPYWVVEQEDLCSKLIAITLDQCDKGSGYPLVLAEAHQAAVISAREREQFYQLIQQIAVSAHKTVASSCKLQRKRLMHI